MKLYRTAGGLWVANQAEWRAGMEAEGHVKPGTPDLIEVPINPKSALVDFLNALNAEPEAVSEPYTPPAETEATTPTATLEELWAKAPLRRRLDMAVGAIDAAVEMMGKMSKALTAKSQ